jgi:hypothetical protein
MTLSEVVFGKANRKQCPDCGKMERRVRSNLYWDIAHAAMRCAQGKVPHPTVVRNSTFRCPCFLKYELPEVYALVMKRG